MKGNTMNNTILLDRERIERIAATYGLEPYFDAGTNGGEQWTYCRVAVPFEGFEPSRADVTWVEADNVWTVDPYLQDEPCLTADQARAVARSIESAADLADDLNVPHDVASWESIRRMNIDQVAEYAESIGSPLPAVFRVIHPK